MLSQGNRIVQLFSCLITLLYCTILSCMACRKSLTVKALREGAAALRKALTISNL